MNILLRTSAFSLLLCCAGSARAWEPNRVKVDAGVNVRFNVYLQDQKAQSLAPWYLYWPAEAANLPQPGTQGMNFPSWPGAWPPPADKKPAANPKAPAAGMLTPPNPGAGAPPFGWSPQPQAAPGPIAGSPASTFQPVGYYTQVPSYWYGN